MGRTFTKTEIIEKLKWFHGEEFEKYPLVESFMEHINSTEKVAYNNY